MGYIHRDFKHIEFCFSVSHWNLLFILTNDKGLPKGIN